MARLGAGALAITWTQAVNARFDKRKGQAQGLRLTVTASLACWAAADFPLDCDARLARGLCGDGAVANFSRTSYRVVGLTPNMGEYLGQPGFTPLQVASLSPRIGASVISGTIGSGWLVDRNLGSGLEGVFGRAFDHTQSFASLLTGAAVVVIGAPAS